MDNEVPDQSKRYVNNVIFVSARINAIYVQVMVKWWTCKRLASCRGKTTAANIVGKFVYRESEAVFVQINHFGMAADNAA